MSVCFTIFLPICYYQTFFRNLVDDWLEHYRLAVGLKSPHMLNVRESPDFSSQARNIQSAKLADGGQAARLKHLGLETLVDYKKQRAPSAPLGKSNKDSGVFLTFPKYSYRTHNLKVHIFKEFCNSIPTSIITILLFHAQTKGNLLFMS